MDHRKINQNLAQKDFQEVAIRLREETDKLEKMETDEKEAHGKAGTFMQVGGNQGPALMQVHEFLKGQKVRIQMQKQKIQEIEKLVEAKREILRQATQDYKIIEKMRENKFESFKNEFNSQEQKAMDEQNILRFKNVKES